MVAACAAVEDAPARSRGLRLATWHVRRDYATLSSRDRKRRPMRHQSNHASREHRMRAVADDDWQCCSCGADLHRIRRSTAKHLEKKKNAATDPAPTSHSSNLCPNAQHSPRREPSKAARHQACTATSRSAQPAEHADNGAHIRTRLAFSEAIMSRRSHFEACNAPPEFRDRRLIDEARAC